MPDNIYQYGVPMQNNQNQIQNNNDQDNDQLIQGIPIQNINEQQQVLRQIMENSDNDNNNIIQNNNNNQQNMLTNQIIVNPNNGQILITHLERNRNININYGRVYVNEGYHIKKRRQFLYFSAIKYLDKIAMRLHDNFNYILKDISFNHNLNFRNDAQESVEFFVNNKIIQHNQISQYEQEKLNDTNFIWTCRHQITKIQMFFKCILNVLFILNVVQWSLIIARHAFQDHFEQQSEENGMHKELPYEALLR
ncbi:hypothetical protein PPERSA_09629 [Pseudocohnilembus persalinus]|uniref:Transmembrane protein n=1 Tax=Pseudocohnilembus persalinus TaxID=266149 RepID=A0A0V0QFN7_PSEPJ|nr:hypothetical protein PPERSA_09629 [Pseudocohnilembus persalinus]|eukprot:KRX01023.1 hypothetical protein PPERSA_09629 [Pseudocohnilembus persalinus]